VHTIKRPATSGRAWLFYGSDSPRAAHQGRAAGVGFEDRQDLLGHRSARMTTHYSAAVLSMLIQA
jgi:integrase